MMTFHKLSAGNGYTYLTRQVAANDERPAGYANLGEYYSERGESPGVWLGRGLDGLAQGPAAGERVHEQQMVALFGQGRHPNADAIEQAALAVGAPGDAATALGRPFNVRSATTDFRHELARRVAAHNLGRGARAGAAVDDEVRSALRTELGREWFVRDHGREPADTRELTDYVTGAARPGTQSVAGYDLTFSPVKSVSTLWALADPQLAAEVAAAHEAAVRDVVDWLEREVVYTRSGHGGTAQVNTRGLLAVAFTHRDSRAGDPDLHTHVAISNKVQALDGRWLALDGRPLYGSAVSASERYNTRLEALLTARLGLRFTERPSEDEKRPVREVVGVDPELAQFWSKRRAAITGRQKQLAADFSRTHGRTPDFGEQTRLYARANTETRKGKHAPRSEREQRASWWQEAAAILGGEVEVAAMPDRVGAGTGPPARPVSADINHDWVRWTAADVIASAAASAGTWRAGVVRAEVERRARYANVPLAVLDAVVEATLALALSPELSVRLGCPDEVEEPAALRRYDGTSVFALAGAQLYTSATVLDAEARILQAATRDDGRSLDAASVELALVEARATGVALNDGQTELVRALATSGRRVQLALAPAGSGKTIALGVLARAWADAGGEVLGLAPTGRAAEQLRHSIGTTTDTVAKLLHTLETGTGPQWVARIGDRTLIVVDEAGAVGTPALDRLIACAQQRGASVRLVGDTHQLTHPASGGVLRDISETPGATGLNSLVRFTDPVEAHASLALRAGDPVALGYYLDHDRIHAGDHASTVEQAYLAWRADRDAGRDSILLAHTRDLVRELNARARAERVAHGSLHGPEVRLHDRTLAGAGDTIVTRRNNRRLPITATDWVKNGDRWLVHAVSADGGLRVIHADTHRSVVLPATYVRRHVELGYASTIHLAQGSTADTCHTMLTGRESREALYVAMSRGRNANHAYVDIGAPGDVHAAITPEAIRPSTSVELLERILANESAPRSATTQRRLDEDPAARLRAAAARYRAAVESAPGAPGTGDGPLPWLPGLATTDDATWADYLARRLELVRALADEIRVPNTLPDTRWATHLQQQDPDLARQVAVWRAAHNVPVSDFRPCGPAGADDSLYCGQLNARVIAQVGTMLGPTDRWRPLIDSLVSDLGDDPHWPVLAASLERADHAGYDVAARLPALIAQRPLPETHAGRELYYRLGSECEQAFAPIPSHVYSADPSPRVTRPETLPNYARSPSISRGGPRR